MSSRNTVLIDALMLIILLLAAYVVTIVDNELAGVTATYILNAAAVIILYIFVTRLIDHISGK